MAAVINLDTIRLTRNIEDTPSREPISAEIILFPGIRYERWDDEADGSADIAASAGSYDKRALSQD